MTSEPPVAEPSELPPIVSSNQELPVERRPWIQTAIDNPYMVLGMLFFCTAALGLPVLWKSKAFSANAKIVWSIAVSVYTIVILWLFYLVMAWSYQRITDSLA